MGVDPGAKELIDRLTRRVEALEQNLDAVLRHLERAVGPLEAGGDLPDLGPPDETGEIVELLRHGNKTEALRLYMNASGGGLKDAKAAIKQLQAEHGL